MRSFPENTVNTVSSVSDSASGAAIRIDSPEVPAYPRCDDRCRPARARPPQQVPSRIADDADGADARATFPFGQLGERTGCLLGLRSGNRLSPSTRFFLSTAALIRHA